MFIYCLQPCCCRYNVLVMRKGLFPVYRLAVDAKPVGWWCSRLKISELAQRFSDGYNIKGSLRHFASTARGLYWFLWVHTTTGYVSREQSFFYDNRDNRDNREKKENGRMSTPCRIFTKGEVLPYRQPHRHISPRAAPPVTNASLSTAFTSLRSVGPRTSLRLVVTYFLFAKTERQQREKRERENVTLYQLTSKRVDGLTDFQ